MCLTGNRCASPPLRVWGRGQVRIRPYTGLCSIMSHPPKSTADGAASVVMVRGPAPLGRFMTPDWAAKPVTVPYAKFGDPQTLNLYTYVENSPLNRIDADGHCAEDACVVETLAGATILVMATQAYFAMPASQRDFGTSLSQAASSVGGTIRSWFQSSDNSKTTPAPQSNPAPGTQTGASPTTAPAVPLPSGLVGTQDDKSGPSGGRHLSGPLDPAHGGSGDAGKDFGTLTGGKSGPAAPGDRYPAGTQVGDNKVALRPDTSNSGPRIEIPANADKPHETLHYPKPSTVEPQ
jgi:hypothetical protein